MPACSRPAVHKLAHHLQAGSKALLDLAAAENGTCMLRKDGHLLMFMEGWIARHSGLR